MSDAENEELFTTRMRKATRKIHSVSDALVNAKFAISLRDENVWGGGLYVFYHIFAYLEDAKQRLNMPDFNNLFVHEILHRKKAFEEDLKHYLGDDWQSTPKSRALENYLQHLQDLEKDNPSLLMAYVYHLYLGLLSGGQILAKKRRIFGETLETTSPPGPPSELGTLSVETQKNNKDQEIDMMQEDLVLEILENATKIASSLTKSDSEQAVSSLKLVTELPLFNTGGNPTKSSESIESHSESNSEKAVSSLKAVTGLPLVNNGGNPTKVSESIEFLTKSDSEKVSSRKAGTELCLFNNGENPNKASESTESLTKSDSETSFSSLKAVTELSLFNNEGSATNTSESIESLTKSDSEKAVSSLKVVTELPLVNNGGNPIKVSESIESLTQSDSEKAVSSRNAGTELPLFDSEENPNKASESTESLTKSDFEKAVSSLNAVTGLPLVNNGGNASNTSESIESLTKSVKRDSEKAVSLLKAVTDLHLFNNGENPNKASESIESMKPTSAPNSSSVMTEEKKAKLIEKRQLRKQRSKLRKQQKELLFVITPGNEATCSPTTVVQTVKSTFLTEVTHIPDTASETNITLSSPICENALICSNVKQAACSEKSTFAPELVEDKQKTDASKNNSSLPSSANVSIPNKPPDTTNLITKENSNVEFASDPQPKLEEICIFIDCTPSYTQNSDKKVRFSESNIITESPVKPTNSKCITKTRKKLASGAIVEDVSPTPFLSNSQSKKKTKKEKRALAMLVANQQNSDCTSPALILKKSLKVKRMERQMKLLATALKRQSTALKKAKNNKSKYSRKSLPENVPLGSTINLETENDLSFASGPDLQTKAVDAHSNKILTKGQLRKRRKKERLAILAAENKQQNLNGSPVVVKKSEKKRLKQQINAEKQRIANLAARTVATKNSQYSAPNEAKNIKPDSQKKLATTLPNTGWLPNSFPLQGNKALDEQTLCFVPPATGSSKRKRVSQTEDSASSTTLTFSLTASMERILQQSRKNVNQKAIQEQTDVKKQSTLISHQSEPRTFTKVGQKSWTNDTSNVDHIDFLPVTVNQKDPSKLTNKINYGYSTGRAINCSNKQSTLISCTNNAVNMYGTDSTASGKQQNPSRSWYYPSDCALFPSTKSPTYDKTYEYHTYSESASKCRHVLPDMWTNKTLVDYPTDCVHIPKNQQCNSKTWINEVVYQNDYDLTPNYLKDSLQSWTNKKAVTYPTVCTHMNQHDCDTSCTKRTTNVYDTDSDQIPNYCRRNPDKYVTGRSPSKNHQESQKSLVNENRNILQNNSVPTTTKNQSGSPKAWTNERSHDYPNKRDDEYPTDRPFVSKTYQGLSKSLTIGTAANVSRTNSVWPSEDQQDHLQLWTDDGQTDCSSDPMSIPLNLNVPLNCGTNYTISENDANFSSTSNNRQNHPELWIERVNSSTYPINQKGPLKLSPSDICSVSPTASSMDQQRKRKTNTEEGEEYNNYSDLDDECCVAVTTSPFHELSEEQAEYIRFRVDVASEKIVSNPNACDARKAPSFHKVLFQDRVIKYWCEDYYTVDWLRRTITSVRSTCPGKLVVCKQSEIPKMHEIFIIIPKVQGKSIEHLILKLKKQNVVRYNIESWSLRRVKSVSLSEQFKWVLIFGVSLEERMKLERFGRIFYSLGETDVYFDDASLVRALHDQAKNNVVPKIHAKKNMRRDTEERMFLNRRRPSDSSPYNKIPEKKCRF